MRPAPVSTAVRLCPKHQALIGYGHTRLSLFHSSRACRTRAACPLPATARPSGRVRWCAESATVRLQHRLINWSSTRSGRHRPRACHLGAAAHDLRAHACCLPPGDHGLGSTRPGPRPWAGLGRPAAISPPPHALLPLPTRRPTECRPARWARTRSADLRQRRSRGGSAGRGGYRQSGVRALVRRNAVGDNVTLVRRNAVRDNVMAAYRGEGGRCRSVSG